LDAAFDLRERLEEANIRKGAARQERLERADEALSLVRLYLRLAVKWKWLRNNPNNRNRNNGFRLSARTFFRSSE